MITAIHPLDGNKYIGIAFSDDARPLIAKIHALDTECDIIFDAAGIVIVVDADTQWIRQWKASPNQAQALAWAIPILLNIVAHSKTSGTIDVDALLGEGFRMIKQWKFHPTG